MFVKSAYAQATLNATQVATDGAAVFFEKGILGAMVVALMAFVVYMHRSHKEERREARADRDKRDEQQRQHDEKRDSEFMRASDKQAASSEKLADAIAGLSRDIYKNNNNMPGGGS